MPAPTGDPSTTLLHDNNAAMHWRRILLLSLAGIVTGAGSSYGLVGGAGVYLWVALGCVASAVLARTVRKSIFLHGFLAGLLAGVLDGATKAILFPSYVASNPGPAMELAYVPPYVSHPWFLVLVGLTAGTLYGGILGFAVWGIVKLFPAGTTAPSSRPMPDR
jgi:hypothetical protein